MGERQSRVVTLWACSALKCPPTGVSGLCGMTRYVQGERSCHWAHMSFSFGRTSATKEQRCRGTAGGYYRCSGPGVPVPAVWPAPSQKKLRRCLPARDCVASRRGPARCCRVSIKALPLDGEGSVQEKALFPVGGKKAYKRRLLPLAKKEGLDKKA
jgi:hypothetical protein